MLNHRDTSARKLLHIVGKSRYGGVVRIILPLAKIAQAEGWQVDVLTTDPSFQQAVRQHGLGLVDLDVIRRDIRPLWDLGGLVRLCRFLRRQHYQIVHTHTSKGGVIGRLAARLAGVPVIVHTAHGFAIHEGSPRLARLACTALERVASQWCDRIVCVSEFHRKWALELGMCSPRRIVAIPNGISDISRDQRTGLEDIRRQFGVRDSDLMILSMSRLAPDKGLEYLIGAASLLPSSIQVRIIIAGDGPSRDSLERLANRLDVMDRVTFAGFREDVLELLAVCDVLALPSLREGLSIALLEAMAAGKPIIATSIGSQREVAAHADMALLVPPLNAVSVSQAIQRMAGDRALMARLGSNARAVYERYYTEDRMLQSYRQLYLDLLATKCGVATRTNLGPGRFLQHEECWMKECVIDGVQSNSHPEVQP